MALHDIRYFLALSRTLNFTKTTEACGVSQPTLSRAIHEMKDELGGLLFSREHNNTHVTELGRLIELHLLEAAPHAEHAEEAVTRFLTLKKANLASRTLAEP
jgi:LysR family hydrogen peroxide-inducible transcriptional activator